MIINSLIFALLLPISFFEIFIEIMSLSVDYGNLPLFLSRTCSSKTLVIKDIDVLFVVSDNGIDNGVLWTIDKLLNLSYLSSHQ